MPSESLKLLSKSWSMFHSPATRPSTQTKHNLFSISTMTAELLTRRMNCHLFSWNHWLSWWLQPNSQCSITTIASYQSHCVIYIDGSASRGTRNGLGEGGRGQLQLLLEDPHSSLKSSPPSKGKEGLLPANMRRKQLPQNLHYPGHPPTPTILQSPYTFA